MERDRKMDVNAMERELRRNQNTLVIVGGGVILFGFWSFIKLILVFILQRDKLLEMLGDSVSDSFELVLVFGFFAILLLIDLSLRLFVGRSARAEGFGRKKGRAYLVVGFIMATFLTVILILSIVTFSMINFYSVPDMVVTFAVDLTSLFTLLELLVTAVRVKRLTRALEKEA